MPYVIYANSLHESNQDVQDVPNVQDATEQNNVVNSNQSNREVIYMLAVKGTNVTDVAEDVAEVEDITDVAHRYYERGFTPIPCEPRSKKPVCKWSQWQYRRPTWDELEQVWRKALQKYGGNVNIATILGRAHGLCAVDIDNPEAFKQARQAIGLKEEDIATWTTLSHRGGALIFRYPDGDDLPSKLTNKTWGAELLGNERILMLPPSTHPEGTRYRWVTGYSPDKIQLKDIPEALLHAFVGESPNEAQPLGRSVAEKVSMPDVEGASLSEGTVSLRPLSPAQKRSLKAILVPYWIEGYRHDLALSLGGLLAKEGVAREDAWDLVCQIAAEAKDMEWKDRERAVRDSFERLWKGESVVGYKRLEEIVGEDDAGLIATIVRGTRREKN